MSHPAGDDENAKADEHPVEGQVAAFANEVNEGERDSEVSRCDKEIGDKMEPDQARVPEVAMPVGHEAVCAKEL